MCLLLWEGASGKKGDFFDRKKEKKQAKKAKANDAKERRQKKQVNADEAKDRKQKLDEVKRQKAAAARAALEQRLKAEGVEKKDEAMAPKKEEPKVASTRAERIKEKQEAKLQRNKEKHAKLKAKRATAEAEVDEMHEYWCAGEDKASSALCETWKIKKTKYEPFDPKKRKHVPPDVDELFAMHEAGWQKGVSMSLHLECLAIYVVRKRIHPTRP